MLDNPQNIFFIVLAIIAFLTIKNTFSFVPQGHQYTVEKFGKYKRTFDPGLGMKIPWIETIGRKINMMEQVLNVPSQEVITKDNAVVTVDGVVFYQVLNAPQAAYEVNNLEYAVLNLTMTNIRTVLGGLDLDESLSKRDQINQRLLSVVDEATSPWGIKVTRIEIKDIKPPHDLVQSMARQMKAEREKRADILEAEGKRQAAILRAEGEKQSVVLQAEGDKEAAFREAEARERLAEAEAKATHMVSKAIDAGNTQAINYFVATKYLEAFGKFADSPNSKTLLIPMEATGILSSLAGITEIAKEALQEDKKS
ncbi:Protein QmcA (possibly involved in integral membrane quality control) [hydrothermal vent metagenome]|uniref:Protein QmcA (Possibly involved in integral membrane quality control) n=1 Tax=hydrothermal vent metagenome TaxID=652676 RepID=A0A3B0UQ04_9ZZZZ